MSKIQEIFAKAIKNSRGEQTIEAQVVLEGGAKDRASVPIGKSVGGFEARVLPVALAIDSIEKKITPALRGLEATNQEALDRKVIELDGTDAKEKLGANATLAVSLAAARAAAAAQKLPLYRWLNSLAAKASPNFVPQVALPSPQFNLINGGLHAQNNLDFQEYMVVCEGFGTFKEKFIAGEKIFEQLKALLEKRKLSTEVGEEGGFAPNLPEEKEALRLLEEAVKQAGFKLGSQVSLAIDVAATALPSSVKVGPPFYHALLAEFPALKSLEDPFAQEEWHIWAQFKIELEKQNEEVMLVGDDLFATHPDRLQKGVSSYVANAILVKPNQIGTLWETLQVIDLARRNQYRHIISHRSGETLDDFIADLAVATGAPYIKAGAPNATRPERMKKYERLVTIEKELSGKKTS